MTYVRLMLIGVAGLLVLDPVAPVAAFQSRAPAGPWAPRSAVVVPQLRPDRHFIALPPAYPQPPAGFVRLPSNDRTLVVPDRPFPRHGRVWVPARTDVVVGLDAAGRPVHVLEYTPGRFERPDR